MALCQYERNFSFMKTNSTNTTRDKHKKRDLEQYSWSGNEKNAMILIFNSSFSSPLGCQIRIIARGSHTISGCSFEASIKTNPAISSARP